MCQAAQGMVRDALDAFVHSDAERAKDVIDLSAFGYSGVEDIRQNLTQVGNDTVLQADVETSVTIYDTLASQLTTDDFLFV